MRRDIKYILRLLLVFLVLQTFAPVLSSAVAPSDEEKSLFTPVHNSFVFPTFLKEQEEREQEETGARSLDLTPLIDFSNRSLSCTASQSLIYKGFNQKKFHIRPALFKINEAFLI